MKPMPRCPDAAWITAMTSSGVTRIHGFSAVAGISLITVTASVIGSPALLHAEISPLTSWSGVTIFFSPVVLTVMRSDGA